MLMESGHVGSNGKGKIGNHGMGKGGLENGSLPESVRHGSHPNGSGTVIESVKSGSVGQGRKAVASDGSAIKSIRNELYVGVYLMSWIISSVLSLFFSNHLLKNSGIGEDVFTLWQLACSVIYGLLFTKVLRLHPLAELTRTQLRAVVPLSLAYLVKELLKYASLGRVSVNLFNTIRVSYPRNPEKKRKLRTLRRLNLQQLTRVYRYCSLYFCTHLRQSSGPFFSIILEIVFLKHFPTNGMVFALIPIIGGVAATSLDEMQAAGESMQLVVYGIGLFSAVASTAINNAQNIYSKILFGQKRIDPTSLQIYLSAISFLMVMPYKTTTSLTSGGMANMSIVLFPNMNLCLQLLVCGFTNFLAAQLAFSTLHLISPVSYSVSNTFKRIVITILAVTVFHERLTLLNGAGIATSIVGVFFYERAVRSYKQAKLYEINHDSRTRV